MENTNTIPEGTLVGGVERAGVEMRDLSAGDPWSEATFFAPTVTGDTGSEHLQPWPVNGVIAGIFKGLRTANKNGPKDKQRAYAVFEDDNGGLFRCYTPGQLRYQLELVEEGAYVRMQHLGKEYVESQGKELHQFNSKVIESSAN